MGNEALSRVVISKIKTTRVSFEIISCVVRKQNFNQPNDNSTTAREARCVLGGGGGRQTDAYMHTRTHTHTHTHAHEEAGKEHCIRRVLESQPLRARRGQAACTRPQTPPCQTPTDRHPAALKKTNQNHDVSQTRKQCKVLHVPHTTPHCTTTHHTTQQHTTPHTTQHTSHCSKRTTGLAVWARVILKARGPRACGLMAAQMTLPATWSNQNMARPWYRRWSSRNTCAMGSNPGRPTSRTVSLSCRFLNLRSAPCCPCCIVPSVRLASPPTAARGV